MIYCLGGRTLRELNYVGVYLTYRREGPGKQGEGCCRSARIRPIALNSVAGTRVPESLTNATPNVLNRFRDAQAKANLYIKDSLLSH